MQTCCCFHAVLLEILLGKEGIARHKFTMACNSRHDSPSNDQQLALPLAATRATVNFDDILLACTAWNQSMKNTISIQSSFENTSWTYSRSFFKYTYLCKHYALKEVFIPLKAD